MGAKINIADILKDKPKRTKLYTDTFGELSIEDIDAEDELGITLSSKDDDELLFYNDGRYNLYGEPILVPSKSMHDWRKFAWKKGDVLVSKDNVYITFEEFENDDYTRFKGKHYLWREYDEEDYSKEETGMLTSKFEKVNNNDAQTYINTIEKRLGGKINRQTLEVENAQIEFKDGDIAFADFGITQDVFIVSGKTNLSEGYYSYVVLNLNTTKTLSIGYKTSFFKENLYTLRFATEEEKQQLFDALAKECKRWDADKKEVVALRSLWTPKPFDRVITRNAADDIWTANIFSHMDSHGEYVTIACVGGYTHCLPYNEETAKLIGTTKKWRGLICR